MTTHFARYVCWEPVRIGQVISRTALTVDRATFLATHVPMRRIADLRRNRVIDESALLEELHTQGERDQHVFAVVQGMAGAGKSHLIRWLKEQYALAHPGDAVVLIAREDNSLRSTIQQIINADILDPAHMPHHLKRLQGAIDLLSPEILAERLINSLQEAVRASDWERICEHLGDGPTRLNAVKIESFLLDKNVRKQLQAGGGPIARLTRFLTLGTGDGAGQELAPGFEEHDLEFDRDLRREIRDSGGYREVIDLCDDLADPRRGAQTRAWLTRYFNYQLQISAVGNATQLAAGDLRAMLADLRRALRRAGKHLALFIEDITAFTGLDTGLIEALVAEHRGEQREAVCRLLSIVGITDTYYTDKFPDNIKDRVTHRFALNDERSATERREAELMRDPASRAELAVCYLNAIRLPHADLSAWFDRGAPLDALPNACAACAMCATCHAAFGNVALDGAHTGDSAERVPIGLYPFNQQALDSLYAFLRDDRSRTQRTFLADIVAHVLQTHGDLIPAGDFPPAATEVAAAVNPPGLNPPAHERVIEEQGGDAAPRLRTLFLFWGKRNVTRTTTPAGDLVGGLPAAVMTAFGLPQITGVVASAPLPAPVEIAAGGKTGESGKTVPDDPKPDVTPPAPPLPQVRSRFGAIIERWANGEPLHRYEDLVDYVTSTIKDFLDWQSHGVSYTQVDAYLKRRFFTIEGQAGSPSLGSRMITLPRTSETRDFLNAVSDFYTSTAPLTEAEVGEQLATISSWLRTREAEIVTFLCNPDALPLPDAELARLLAENAAMLACLAGQLSPEAATDVRILYREMMAASATSNDTKWASIRTRFEEMGYPVEWTRLMRDVDRSGAVHRCRQELLNLLMRPLGVATDASYFDAAVAMRHLQALIDRKWQPAPVRSAPDANDALWDNALAVHRWLSQSFGPVVAAADSAMKQEATMLAAYMGGAAAHAVFEAIDEALDDLNQVSPPPLALQRLDPGLEPKKVDELRAALTAYAAAHGPMRAPRLGRHFGQWHTDCTKLNKYFTEVVRHMKSESARFDREMQQGGEESGAEQAFQRVQRRYGETVDGLAANFALDGLQTSFAQEGT